MDSWVPLSVPLLSLSHKLRYCVFSRYAMCAGLGKTLGVPALKAYLDAAPGEHRGPILRSDTGRLWTSSGASLRSAWGHVCRRAGIKGVTVHDLRGTFATHKLSEGWSPTEVAMCTGHTLRDLASLDVYADRKVVARRTAERLAASSFRFDR